MHLYKSVPSGMVTAETQAMLAWFQCYYSAFPEQEAIDVDELISLVRLRCGTASREQLALTIHMCQRLREEVPEASIQGILGQLHELDLSGRAGALLSKYNAGEEVDLAYELNKLSAETVRALSQSAPTDYIDTSIDDLLNEISEDKGIKLNHIALLRENITGLQGGALIAIAARPDKGKTSFIAALVTAVAAQCVEFFGVDRPILWLNNEGSGKRIIPRLYQAALQKDLTEIIQLSNSGELGAAYCKAIGAPQNYIRVKDMHGASLAQVEQVIEAMNPCMVVHDMAANYRTSGVQGGNKTDALELTWQSLRELAVQHDHIAAATIQISAEGGNMLYPPYSALKDSKTGVQGAADIVLMLGSLDNPDAQNLRGLSTPKNKFSMPGKQSYVQGEVWFDASKCAYSDGG